MIRKTLDLSQAIRDFSDRADLYRWFQMEYEQAQSNVKILAKAKQAINICKAHACLRFLFISLRAYAPWCLLLSLHMEASPKDHSQTEYPTEMNPVSILCCNRKWGDFSLLFIVICCINQCFAEDCKGSFLLLFAFGSKEQLCWILQMKISFSLLCLWTTVCGTVCSWL